MFLPVRTPSLVSGPLSSPSPSSSASSALDGVLPLLAVADEGLEVLQVHPAVVVGVVALEDRVHLEHSKRME